MNSELLEARHLVLKLLDAYEESGKSIRFLLRRIRPEVSLPASIQTFVRLRALGVIQFLNTIDFICVRALKRRDFSRLETRNRSLLRLVTYELRWLGTKKSELDALSEDFPNLDDFMESIESFALDASLKSQDQIGTLSVKYSHPSFLVKTFLDNLPLDDSIELMNSNNSKRDYYFRVNQLIYNQDNVLEDLNGSGVSFEADEDVPGLYRLLEGEIRLFKSDSFRKNQLLVQDKSSVLAARALNPQSGTTVWDACAAPGMKTHVLWEMMKQRGVLVATDIDSNRIELAQRRMAKSGLDDVNFMVADAMNVPIEDADRILIDAPCSSTGILRSHPSYKWLLNKTRLQATMTIQHKLLDRIVAAYSERPGTEVVFATCSLLPHEGESQIDSLLKRHRIELLDIPFNGSKGYPGFKCSEKVVRLFPHRHNCNGFFISRFRIITDTSMD